MPQLLDDLWQQFRLLQGRVDELTNPTSSFVGGGGDDSGGGLVTGTSSGGPVAMFELPGPVIPVAAADSPLVPIMGATTVIQDVVLTLAEGPATGLTCVVDVFLNGISLFAVQPSLGVGAVSGHFALDAAPVAVVPFVDVITAAVITPAGRTLTIAVS